MYLNEINLSQSLFTGIQRDHGNIYIDILFYIDIDWHKSTPDMYPNEVNLKI